MYGPRVREMRERYAVALRVLDAAEYRDMYETERMAEYGSILDDYSTIEYAHPAAPGNEAGWACWALTDAPLER